MGTSTTWSVPGFVVEELIGFGGTGEVWRGRDVATGRHVALKRLRPAGGVAERDRLRREAALLAGVVSPHLVRLRTAVTTADGLVVVLDYAAGGSLAALLGARRRLLPGEVVTIGEAVAAALVDVRAVGLTHGDVSPANVLFAIDGRPLLSDLGIAVLAGMPPGGGTPGFADPVVLAGGEATPASDVYGLAATCYAALTGAAPLPGDTAEEVLAALAAGRRGAGPLLRPSVPPGLLQLVESALAPDPAQRPDLASFAAGLRGACRPARVRLAGASSIVAAAPTELDPPVSADGEAAPTDAASYAVAHADPASRPDVLARRTRARRWTADEPRRSLVDRARQSRPSPWVAGMRDRLADRAAGRAGPVAAMLAGVLAAGAVLTLCVVGGVWWAGAGRERPPTFAMAHARHHAASASTPRRSAPQRPAASPTALPSSAGGGSSASGGGSSALGCAVSASPSGGPVDFADVVRRLDAARDSAFADDDPASLGCAYARSSAAYRADAAKLRALMAAGERADGLRLTVRDVAVAARRGSLVEVVVRDELPPYRIVDLTGHPVVTRRGRGPAAWRVVLRLTSAGWRILTVAPGGGS